LGTESSSKAVTKYENSFTFRSDFHAITLFPSLPLAEEDRIVSETESAALQGGIQACKTIINDLVSGKFPSSPTRIK
jgi:hypothetical protein